MTQDGSSTPKPDAAEASESAFPAHGLSSHVILDALVDQQRISDLTATSVPAWLMAEPIELAVDWLVDHGKHCRRPTVCPDTPPILRVLLKMRRPVMKQHESTMHEALWRYPSSTMVKDVREETASRHDELVTEIRIGALFDPDHLHARIADLTPNRAAELAAALWSTEFDDERSIQLFELLPALAEAHRTPDEQPPVDVRARPPKQPQEKRRHRDKRLALEQTVAELKSQLDSTRADVRTRAAELSKAHRAVEMAEQARLESDEQVQELGRDLALAAERERSLEAQVRDAERLQKQSSAAAGSYRVDLARAQEELSEAEAERSALQREVAAAHAQLQDLTGRLRALPRDKEAISDWLCREEARLRDLEYTVEGGQRQRVAEEKRLRRRLELAFVEAYPEFQQARPATIPAIHRLTFHALGGGNEVGRSAYHITIGSLQVLVDCGIAVGARRQEDEIPNISLLTRLDGLLVTHAHTDHVGWIPALVPSIESFPIYCTRPTAELLPIMLKDSHTHYLRKTAQERLKRQYNPAAEKVRDAYTRDDIIEAELRVIEADMSEPIGIGSTELTATFFPAGHILGAASILVEGGGRRIIISGDVSSDYQHTVGPYMVPSDVTDVDLLVLESTYGDRVRPPGLDAETELVRFVAKTVQNGIALLPCFALGRAQEVIAILISARRAGQLPPSLTILVDGMINKINPIYTENAKLESSDFIEVGNQLDRELAFQAAVAPDPTPTVVVTTSGMLAGGPVIEWARMLLSDARHRMALLGYQDEGAPGGLLRKLAAGRPPYVVTLYDEEGEPLNMTIAGPVASIGLSAHADQDGLVRYAAAVRPQRIVLVHGEESSRRALQERLVAEDICRDVRLSQEVNIP